MAFAFLPDNWIKQELTNAALHLIPLQESFQRSLPLYLMFADRPNAGPATRALAELIQTKIRA
ncbi:MAG TPA: hypothetical protein DCL66_16265 [Gammaproteobacteria bacterium]|nr:hypothetical protein [Gammaproteobacteria bacterium]